ncbi:NADH-quinone oxidoreductase subunit E [bioreactor metagenome]|uniref:NADH-quinone oxidoreductase subunit E n=1 Tax=bioreactor metagenome TaxID=1076179 RepID=A0A645FR98_9ZZZZ
MSERLDVSSAKIYGVATFYENFSLEPKGKHIIKVCDGTACHIRKSQLVLDGLRKELNLTGKSKTTEDMLVTLEQVSCLGACSLAPVLNVDDDVHARMTPAKVQDLVKSIREGEANENQN